MWSSLQWGEKDVNQRIVMNTRKIVPMASVVKEKGGGCFESWHSGGGLWAWDWKVGEGVRSRWCDQSREHGVGKAVWCETREERRARVKAWRALEESFWKE